MKLAAHTIPRYALRGFPYPLAAKPSVPLLVRYKALNQPMGERAGFVAVFRTTHQAALARKIGLRRMYRKVTIVKVRINVTEIV